MGSGNAEILRDYNDLNQGVLRLPMRVSFPAIKLAMFDLCRQMSIFSPEQPIAAEENDETWSLEFLSLGDRVPVLADGRLAAALTALA